MPEVVVESQSLLTAIEEVGAALSLPIDLETSLSRITRSAVETIPGIDYASISVTARDGAIETLAPTDPRANEADQLQYKLRQGPCYDAAHGPAVVRVDDLATDPRWPDYGPQVAASLGLGSQLAFQFRAEPAAQGALNLYAGAPHAIGDDTQQLAALFARLVGVAMGWAQHEQNLSQALLTRQEIGQAVGIVMERYRLDADRAFSFLVRVSQSGNIRLREVARGIIAGTAAQADPAVTPSAPAEAGS
ncbi:GAF and ANTAR domain-containing protein [Kribbella sp. NPDC020789]